MIKDCFRYDGAVKTICLSDGRVKIKLAAKTRTHVAAMGKYNPDASEEPFHDCVDVDELLDSFNENTRKKISLLKKGSPISNFYNINEDDKIYIQLQI